ncbi:putative calcium-activated potassium channel subunit beta [Antedon mediterranea]|uniref:putative calcium-activated potassium channel subunit beta n=1 Tax=Antedon mediterranea TaxID=105859 RepID=UPI003AF4CE54
MTGVQAEVRVVSVRLHKPAIRRYFRMLICCQTLLFMLAIGCIMSLCFCGLFIVKPYIKTHVFEETTCTTKSLHWVDKYDKCCTNNVCEEPGDGVDGFPCLLLRARVVEHGANHSAMVFKDDDTWNMTPKCSYPLCSSYKYYGDEPNHEASAFADKYEVGATYSCYHSPSSNEVILDLTANRQQVIHSMLWPSLGLILTVIAIYALRRHAIAHEKTEVPFTRF